METYVPPSASAGILGGKGIEGEVDDIQAWKKDMKEREQKAKGVPNEPTSVALEPLEPTEDSKEAVAPKPTAEGELDEIQLFKLMMKKEEKKRVGPSAGDAVEDSNNLTLGDKTDAGPAPGLSGVRGSRSTEKLAGM